MEPDELSWREKGASRMARTRRASRAGTRAGGLRVDLAPQGAPDADKCGRPPRVQSGRGDMPDRGTADRTAPGSAVLSEAGNQPGQVASTGNGVPFPTARWPVVRCRRRLMTARQSSELLVKVTSATRIWSSSGPFGQAPLANQRVASQKEKQETAARGWRRR